MKVKECQVDHYPKGAGSIKSVQDIGEFCNNLYCETDNLRVLCSNCHSVHTLAEKLGITWDDALIQQEIIAIMKKPLQEIIDFCQSYEYNDSQLSNAKKRKDAVTAILKGI